MEKNNTPEESKQSYINPSFELSSHASVDDVASNRPKNSLSRDLDEFSEEERAAIVDYEATGIAVLGTKDLRGTR